MKLLMMSELNFITQLPLLEIGIPEMADHLRESGKIYIVVGVIAVIFTGIWLYVATLEGKIRNLEKNRRHK